MKKLLIIAAILAALFAAFSLGRASGIRHAIQDSTIWTVECYNPKHPGENARPDGTDQTIYIDLDGTLYEHGMYQG